MNKQSALLGFISVFLLLLLGPLCSAKVDSQSQTIRIAVNLPLSGPIAAFCGPYPNALTMGIDDACKELHMDRSKFVLDIQDNAGHPSQAVTICRKQLLTNPQVYLSGTSPMSLPIASEVSKANIAHLLVAFDAYLCRSGPNRIRILPNYKIEAPVYPEYAKYCKAKRAFIMQGNNISACEECDKIIVPELNKLGIQFQREIFEFDTKDYRSIVLKAAAYKPDLIIITGCYSVNVYPIISALRSYGLINKDNVVSTMDYIDLLHDGTPKSILMGVTFVCPPYELAQGDKAAADWAQRYKTMYRKDPSYVEAYAYETGRLLVATVHQFGRIDATSLRKTMPFKGICGPITIDKDGDLNTKLSIAKLQKDGSVKKIFP